MRWLVAPQEFKGTLTAVEAARAIASAIRGADPSLTVEEVPLADGGPGTVEAMLASGSGTRHRTTVEDPLGRKRVAKWALFERHEGARTAVIDMAAASGLSLVHMQDRDPIRARTFGTGQLIRAALDTGCQRVLVGIGGSATNDGGVGALEALGARFLDARGERLGDSVSELLRLERIELSGLDPRLKSVDLELLTDVRNPLCGPLGASSIYGPQKGADAAQVALLDRALAQFALIARRQRLGADALQPGAGAGGGLAFGLTALAGGKIRSGFEAVAEALGLANRVARADGVIAGEGRFDRQTSFAKGPWRLAQLAHSLGKQVVLFAGRVDALEADRRHFDEVIEVSPRSQPGEPSSDDAGRWLFEAAERWALGQARRRSG